MTSTASPGSGPGSDAPAWRSWEPGVRVMVRRVLPPGATHLYTDVVGVITATDVSGITLETRTGTVRVPGDEITLGKIVPPARPRRGRPQD